VSEPAKPTRGPGVRYFRCDECGKEWLDVSRDADSPSGESCDCGEWVFASRATTEQFDRLWKWRERA
jgi:hypothetical protein